MKTKQRGSGWSIALVFNLYKLFGYKFIYILMYPVSFFYFIFATNVKKALRDYYQTINIKFTNRIYFKHLRFFAICMVDRFISKVDVKSYTFNYDDITKMTEILNKGTILLCSHFGGWAASTNASHVNNKLNIVMQEVLLEGIKKIEDSLPVKESINIIDLNKGTIRVSVEIANALMNNEIVAIMGDRASNKKAEIEIDFFKRKANFNKNPFEIAYKTDKPILIYFIILMGIQEYKIEHTIIYLDKTKEQEDAISLALSTYIQKYEEVIKKYPEQWFNFYNFWENK
ncbi:lysophospholipid acyltransferase family protein [Halarcobacter bivalviorum]|uniref:Lipid A biosynthesis acyltransferase n=1 Tax=Halarcobacter bivalviorum TaxID=663364 RepID=A0AAX2A5L8_9BACT|nr:lysophospholipid acyltransferase family protein [Halarcobacter bivalviorum]AXH11258.1 lysophospholipid acyltransferase [Halarcobacter bivalviorum]RXK09527.1 lipid A biosynthesis acyltransferase [Halarcobacter bivalviorum]